MNLNWLSFGQRTPLRKTISKKPHILFHRPTPWQSEINCSTKILARRYQEDGFTCSYLEVPLDIGHILKWKGYYNTWSNAPRDEEGVWVINPFAPIPVRDLPLIGTYAAIAASYKTCLPPIRNLLQKGERPDPDVIWAARPGSSALKKLFPGAKLVMQVVDYYPAFRGDAIKEIEKRDYELADHIFVIGNALKQYLVSDLQVPEDRITTLGQGVALENYTDDLPKPKELNGLSSPIGIWVGVMDKVDEEIFEAVAQSLAALGGSLVMIGEPNQWCLDLAQKYSNVFSLGPRYSAEIPRYLCHSDIGLMLYNRDRDSVYKGQNPLKLYEYAAAGLAILSTPHEEFRYLKTPVLTINHPDEVDQAIRNVIENKSMMADESRLFVKDRSWNELFVRSKIEIEKLITPG